jgi:hypothetical protein
MFRKVFHRPALPLLAPIFLFFTLCQAARADTCPTGTKVITLAGLMGMPFSLTFPENSFGARQQCLVTITDYAFPATVHGNAFFVEINTKLSDVLVFRNDIFGRASICFASDPLDRNSCTLDGAPGAFGDIVFESLNTGATYDKRFSDSAGRPLFTVSAFSDGRSTGGTNSDTFRITPVPEPPTVSLFGSILGVLGICQRLRSSIGRRSGSR